MFASVRKAARSVVELADLVPDVLLSRFGIDERARYLFEHVLRVVKSIEDDPAVTTRAEVLRRLRQLGLDDFAYILWSLPDPRFPKLSRLLPSMASADVQRHWTGRSGIALLKPTVNFARIMTYNYARLTGSSLNERAAVLDYGCGYGRIARLMYYFVDEESVTGVDPWAPSIELCRQAGLGANFKQSEYLPSTLPVDDTRFDLIYAYSVFTHLSEAATLAALGALRKCISDAGVLVITVRPVEYWALTRYIREPEAAALTVQHRTRGFAFYPHPQGHEHNAVSTDATYGDTSIAFEWLQQHCPHWSVKLIDRSLNDRLQTYVFLTPN